MGGTAGRGGEGDFTNAKHKGIKRRLGHRDEGARVLLPAELGPRVNIMGDTWFCKGEGGTRDDKQDVAGDRGRTSKSQRYVPLTTGVSIVLGGSASTSSGGGAAAVSAMVAPHTYPRKFRCCPDGTLHTRQRSCRVKPHSPS